MTIREGFYGLVTPQGVQEFCADCLAEVRSHYPGEQITFAAINPRYSATCDLCGLYHDPVQAALAPPATPEPRPVRVTVSLTGERIVTA